jgi:hypothetical protein
MIALEEQDRSGSSVEHDASATFQQNAFSRNPYVMPTRSVQEIGVQARYFDQKTVGVVKRKLEAKSGSKPQVSARGADARRSTTGIEPRPSLTASRLQ